MDASSISYYFLNISIGLVAPAIILRWFFSKLKSKGVDFKHTSIQSAASIPDQDTANSVDINTDIGSLLPLTIHHEFAKAYIRLVNEDGAGSWPPAANFDFWPPAIQPYQDIYTQYTSSLTVSEASLYDDVNEGNRHKFRTDMQKLLQEHINLDSVRQALELDSSKPSVSRDQINAFHGTLAYLRHVYRWASNPIVRVAQLETTIDMPPELDIPWKGLQNLAGFYAESGNHTTNVLLSFDSSGRRRLRTTSGVDKPIMTTEDNFFSLFYNYELNSVPLYFEIIRCLAAFDEARQSECMQHLNNICILVRKLSRVFHSGLTEQKVSKSNWMQYTQGFHGWGLEKVVDGIPITHTGVSGSQVLAFHIIDSFLGLEPYMSNDEIELYVPARQHMFSLAVRRACFRHKLTSISHPLLYDRMEHLAQQMKVCIYSVVSYSL
ncbi:hypothetical protein VHEMI04656 [[Torrubiella] hemipterigena]|uniref:Indoleamine 2,3-dioxygenase n=1 Tax=[Torrubiella] hemipterigena TaxID=1531966 RepID=A0A0A1TEI5_9HYPO|nr:hypothetical protein VHEMI04656 [[Torrubiella] hemipterigena]